MYEHLLNKKRIRSEEEVKEEIEEDKGYYEDEYGYLVVTADMSDSLEPLVPYYLPKIRKHYDLPSREFVSNLSPADFANKYKVDRDEWDDAILGIASAVVAVSIFAGVRRIIDCSGLIIGWDASKEEATILTSARLLKMPNFDSRRNYYIAVRFVNGMIEVGKEEFVDFYHNIMTVKVKCAMSVKVINIDTAQHAEEGTEMVSIGRDFLGTFVEGRGFLRKEYPYIGCQELCGSTCKTTEVSEGGPLVTKDGIVCGIAFHNHYCYVNVLPCHIVSLCLHMFNDNGRVIFPWFGITMIDSNKLSRDALQKFWITSGEETTSKNFVIVKEVYDDSPAKKLELRPGDIVKAHGRCTISSSLEFLELLRGMFLDFNACEIDDCDLKREIKVVTFRYGYAEEVLLKAESVEVSDRKFFACWPQDSFDTWYGKPKIGSQVEPCIGTYIMSKSSCTLQQSVHGGV